MAGDGKNTDDITIPMLFLFNKEGNIILDAIREYEAVEVLLSDKAKDRGKLRGYLYKLGSIPWHNGKCTIVISTATQRCICVIW